MDSSMGAAAAAAVAAGWLPPDCQRYWGHFEMFLSFFAVSHFSAPMTPNRTLELDQTFSLSLSLSQIAPIFVKS